MTANIYIEFDDGSGLSYFDIPDHVVDSITLSTLNDYQFSLKV